VEREKPWMRWWPEGVPLSIKYPTIPLYAFLENSARKYPNRTAVIFYGRRINYASLGEMASRFANALLHLGVRKGDRVALVLPNIPQFIISYYGTLMAGGVIVAINPLNEEGEMERELAESGAKVVVVLDRFLRKVEAVKDGTEVEAVIVAKGEAYLPWTLRLLSGLGGGRGPRGFPRVRTLVRRHPPLSQGVQVDPKEDLAVIQYTGGTTGEPKGVMLTHYSLVANAIQVYHWLRGWGYCPKPQVRGHPVVLAAIPFFHIFGMTVAMNEVIHSGSTMVLLPEPEPGAMMRAIERYKVTHLPATPSLYRAILSHPDLRKRDLRSLIYCVSGGDPIDAETVERFREVAGVEFFEGYGLTEAGPVTHCTPQGCEKRGSIGIPLPDTEARIVDIPTGEVDLPVGEVGELVVRGPQVMRGYLGRARETERALRGGWLYTGDVARMDEDGFFYIVDRKQDRIIARGHTIWPTRVEGILRRHPAVEEAVVVGVADPLRCATDLRALVVLKEEYRGRVGPEELLRFCSERLEDYLLPEEVEVVEDLPRTPLGKISRRAVRERLERGSSLHRRGST